ncbi:unnamed protein product, partial [Effrenium voratum]
MAAGTREEAESRKVRDGGRPSEAFSGWKRLLGRGARGIRFLRLAFELVWWADPVEPAEDALPLRRLFSPSLAERERCCRSLASESLGLAQKALLAQLAATEGKLRLSALRALLRQKWDAEVLNRAAPGLAYGALFFVLDDEDSEVRAMGLDVLTAALCNCDLKATALEGLFQRLATVASLCLHDPKAAVRGRAAAALVEVMTCRKVALSAGKTDKASPGLGTVLQAFVRDPRVVLEVVAAARFGDLQALQQALQWSLEAKLEEPWARRLARHLGAELFRLEAAPKEPSGKRKREAKLDRSLPPGTRLLTASLLRGADPVAPAG